jgi:hypothetical protein
MKAYKFDENGIFEREIMLQPNPMAHIEGESEFLSPPNVTEIAPPEAQEGKLIQFKDGAWILIDDPKVAELAEKAKEEAENLAKIEADKKANELRLQQIQAQRDLETEARKSRLASAAAKLKALGLTDEEVTAMIGV